jgi:ATP-dependent Clp protease, protease subunit
MSRPMGTGPAGTGSAGTWPPLPPSPPEPPVPRHTPWLPEPRPVAPGPVSASASLIVGAPDWLGERLLGQRVVALSGELDP